MFTKRNSMGWIRAGVPLAAATLGAVQAAAAQGTGEWYGGVGFGSAHLEVYRQSWFGFGTWEEGSSNSALLTYGGYRLSEHFAVEMAYLMPSDIGWRENGAYIEDLAGVYDSRTSLSTSAIQLSGVGILPFAERWDVYIKGGISVYSSDGTQTLTDFVTEETLSRPVDASKTGFLLGMGIGVTPTDRWRVRLEYQFFYIDNALINVEPEDDPTFDSWTFGIDYRFGAAR